MPDGSPPPGKVTYHSDGYVHHKVFPEKPGGYAEPLCYGPSLSDFQGFFSRSWNIIQKPVKMHISPAFEEGPADHITYLDVQNSEMGVKYTWFICAPEFPLGAWFEQAKHESANEVPMGRRSGTSSTRSQRRRSSSGQESSQSILPRMIPSPATAPATRMRSSGRRRRPTSTPTSGRPSSWSVTLSHSCSMRGQSDEASHGRKS